MAHRSRLHRVVVLALAIVLAASPAGPAAASSAQTNDGPALQRAREFVEVVNSGDPARVESFVQEAMAPRMRDAFPMEDHVSIIMGTRDRAGNLEIGGVVNATDTAAEVLVRGDLAGEWLRISLEVEPEAPHRLAGLGLQGAEPPASATPDRDYSDSQMGTELTELLDRLAASDRFSGTVRIDRDGETVFSTVRGEANKDFGVANNLDTKFNLGSMNKMFTAVAIAQLVERGELAYDDSLAEYLPDFPDPESARKIRIEHLLSHTSGLGSYFNDEFMNASRARFRTVEDMMALTDDEELAFEPGTQWSYSNTGFLVLGRVIEVVSGRDYYDFIRDNVTGPAGMSSTEAYELDRVNPNLAVGYDLQDGPDGREWRNNIFMHVLRGGPAGGGYSTVGDLVRFADALRDGTLVSRETLEILTTPKPELGSDSYGFGFGIQEDGSVGHTGGFVGINSALYFWVDGPWTLAVMSNYSGGAMPVAARARQLINANRAH